MKRLRVCADNSVYGGCFDEEFAEASRKFFDDVRAGRLILLLSQTVVEELKGAPVEVRELAGTVSQEIAESIELSEEVIELRDAYLNAGVVGRGSRLDAEHVVSASVAGADAIVSWNFRHIVHYKKIRGYHSVNIRQGYPAVPIHTPKEVIEW